MFRWKRSADPKAELKQLIGDYELPSFSAAAVSTLRLIREDADMRVIAERILADPGLSVRVLRTVNSAAFGLRNQVTDLTQAVTLLGRSRVEALVLAAAVGDSLPACEGIDLAGFWRTSARRACLARRIASRVEPASQMEAFTAGLLQDMAVPVLAAAHGERYTAIYRQVEADRAEGPLDDLEQRELGYDHAQVGAMMAESWDLPEGLITAIADHHAEGERAPQAVEAVARIHHREPPDELDGLRAHCRDQLGLEGDALETMIESASEEASSLGESMAHSG